MEKSLFKQMGDTYSKVEGYNLPNLVPLLEESRPIGLWGNNTQDI